MILKIYIRVATLSGKTWNLTVKAEKPEKPWNFEQKLQKKTGKTWNF